MAEFFKVVTPERIFEALSGFPRIGTERVPLEAALGRVAAEDIAAAEDLPPLPRSTMDGFAVRASDTFGASDSIPALLKVAGEVRMGEVPAFETPPGAAAAIPTGGFLPGGTDAVVMIEHTGTAGPGMIEVSRPVTSGENVIEKAGDVAAGTVVIPSGRRLRAQDVGLLAGLGIVEITAGRRPSVAVISTGDEIVPPDRKPPPGKIRDINRHSISAMISSAGAKAVPFDIVPDEPGLLTAALGKALEETDVVALSGGSSVGERDHMLGVVSSVPGVRIIAHGIAISPGKPTLIADAGGKCVFGLPGHPVSAMIVAHVFLLPYLSYLEGCGLERNAGRRIRATLSTSVHSVHGREEYVRVSISETSGGAIAQPVFGKSGMISTMVKADGFVVVPIHSEGIPGGEEVDVILF